MSISNFPRLYFKGNMSFDPSLSNNFSEYYDVVNAQLLNPEGISLAELKKKLPFSQPGSWNHFGTHRAVFEQVKITGVSTSVGYIDQTDILVGKDIFLEGKLVDLDANNDNGTQIFFDELRIGNVISGIVAPQRRRVHARFLNFGRNRRDSIQKNEGAGPATYASAVWDTCFFKEDLQLNSDANSPFLKRLVELFENEQFRGLSMRFHTYRTLYYRNGIMNQIPEIPRNRGELQNYYANDKNFSNPAYSIVIGVITPWKFLEHGEHPNGRILLPAIKADETIPGGRKQVGLLSLAFIEANQDEKRLTIDLGETVPEIGISLEKADVGQLSLIVTDNDDQTLVATLAPEQYNKVAYESTSGLVDIDLSGTPIDTWNTIKNGRFHLIGDIDNRTSEIEFSVVVENRDIYLDEGETCQVPLYVKKRGQPAPNGTLVYVGIYPRGEMKQSEEGPFVVGQDGTFMYNITADTPRLTTYTFKAQSPDSPAPSFDETFYVTQDFHLNVRVLPFDDTLEVSIPDSLLTWNWIYKNILSAYDVMNPVMSRHGIDFPLDNRNRAEALAEKIKRLISKDNFESASYMPVTRDLSNGKRKLILRWCNLVINGNIPVEPAPDSPFRLSDSKKIIGHPGPELI